MNVLAGIGLLTVLIGSVVLVLGIVVLVWDYKDVRNAAFSTKDKVDKMLQIERDNNIGQ
jgi:hypothetical protein